MSANLESRVLVVDDCEPLRYLKTQYLLEAGFHVSQADTGRAALRSIETERPDLVLLDVNLPDGSGFDVCRSLNSEASAFTTPILFISANDDTSTKLQGFEIGGVDYITKPIVGAEVIARVRTHLRLKRAYERLAELQAERVQMASVVAV